LQWYLHADDPFAIDGAAFRDASAAPRLRGRAVLPRDARLRTGPTVLTAPGQPGSIEQGRPDQRGFELTIEPPAAGRAADFDVSFEVDRRARRVSPGTRPAS
jgi:hypothetical protein